MTPTHSRPCSPRAARWARAAGMSASHLAPISLRIFLGDDYPQMARNQVRNLAERRIRAVTCIARR